MRPRSAVPFAIIVTLAASGSNISAQQLRATQKLSEFTLACERVSDFSGGRVSPYTITVNTATKTVNGIPYTEKDPLITWSTAPPSDGFSLNRYTLDGYWVVHLRDGGTFDAGEMHCRRVERQF